MKNLLCGIVAAGSLSLLASAAPGSIVYSYGTDMSNYAGPIGGTVQIKLYFVETLTGGSKSLIVGDDGLNGSGGQIVRVSGNATISGLTLNTAAGTGFDGGPALTTLQLTPTKVDFSDNVSLVDQQGVFGSTAGLPPGVTEVFLGTLTVTIPTVPDMTTFAFGKNPAGAGSTVTFANTFNLDANGSTQDLQYGGPGTTAADGNVYSWTGANNTVGTFTVGFPEPSSLALVGCGGLLALRRRRRPLV
jgi:hypothetical protein